MNKSFVISTFVVAFVLLVCQTNSVVQVESNSKTIEAPGWGRALIILGIDAEEAKRFRYSVEYPVRPVQQYSIALDEFNAKRNTTTANCLRDNKVLAVLYALNSSPAYFAFHVKPGYYLYYRSGGAPVAFQVPSKSIVYAGTFKFSNNNKVTMQRDLDIVREGIKGYFPKLAEKVTLADSIDAAPSSHRAPACIFWPL